MSQSSKTNAELKFTYIKGTKKHTIKNYFLGRLIKGRNTSQSLLSLIVSNAVPAVLLILLMVTMTACGGLKVAVRPEKIQFFQGCGVADLVTPRTNVKKIALLQTGLYTGKPNLGTSAPFAFELQDEEPWDSESQYFLTLEVLGEPNVSGSVYNIESRGGDKVTKFETGSMIPIPVPTKDIKNKKKFVVKFDLEKEQCGSGCTIQGRVIVHKNGQNDLLQSVQAYEQFLTNFSNEQRALYSGKNVSLDSSDLNQKLLIQDNPCSNAASGLKQEMKLSITKLRNLKNKFQKSEFGFSGFPSRSDVEHVVNGLKKVESIVQSNTLYSSLFDEAFTGRPQNTDNIPYVGVDTSTLLSISSALSDSTKGSLKDHHVLSANLYFANTKEDVKRVLDAYSEDLLETILSTNCSDEDCVSKAWSDSLGGFGTQWSIPFGPQLSRANAFTGWIENAGCFVGPIPTYEGRLPLQWLKKQGISLPIRTPKEMCGLIDLLKACPRPFTKIGSLSDYPDVFDPKIDSCIAKAKKKNRGFLPLGAINQCAKEWANIECLSSGAKDSVLKGNILQDRIDEVVEKEITKKWMKNIRTHKTYDKMVCENAGKEFIKTLSGDSFDVFGTNGESGKPIFEQKLKDLSREKGRAIVQKNPEQGVADIQRRFELDKDTVINKKDEFCGRDLGNFKRGGGVRPGLCDSGKSKRINNLFDRVDGIELKPKLSTGGQLGSCKNVSKFTLKAGKTENKDCDCKKDKKVPMAITTSVGYKNILFQGNCPFSINNKPSKKVKPGKHRLKVKKSGKKYVLIPSCDDFTFKSKVVKGK